MSDVLTPQQIVELRKPFSIERISFKIQTNPKEGDEGKGMVVAYIDARDVMDRLDDVAPGQWSDEYVVSPIGGLECRLTVCGITRRDVGKDDNPTEREKSAYADAFKRAAVKFGVGRFLYDSPRMWASLKRVGKTWKMVDGEEGKLRNKMKDYLEGLRLDETDADDDSGGGKETQAAPKDVVDMQLTPGGVMATSKRTNGGAKHWIDDDKARAAFWVSATNLLGKEGNIEGRVKNILGVTSMHDYKGNQGQALTALKERKDKAAVPA